MTDQRAARIAARFVQDTMLQRTASYWERRAVAFEEAAPGGTDLDHGATEERLDEAARRCGGVAVALRLRAGWIRTHRADPSEMNHAEHWIYDNLVTPRWTYPTELERETSVEMIARHQRVLATIDTPRVLVAA